MDKNTTTRDTFRVAANYIRKMEAAKENGCDKLLAILSDNYSQFLGDSIRRLSVRKDAFLLMAKRRPEERETLNKEAQNLEETLRFYCNTFITHDEAQRNGTLPTELPRFEEKEDWKYFIEEGPKTPTLDLTFTKSDHRLN